VDADQHDQEQAIVGLEPLPLPRGQVSDLLGDLRTELLFDALAVHIGRRAA
jgi:hypothetical protein